MIVLDTNVLSEAMKPSPDPAVARWMVRERGRGLFTTAVSKSSTASRFYLRAGTIFTLDA